MPTHLAPISRNQFLDLEALLQLQCSARNPSKETVVSPTPAPLPSTRTAITSYRDIFRDPTCKHWSLADKALYLVWWSHRPQCCKECGSVDCWVPSSEDEYRCGHCGSGAGTTAQGDTVDEIHFDDDDDSDDEGGEGIKNDTSAPQLYAFYLTWLMSLPKVLLRSSLPKGLAVPLVLRSAFDIATVLTHPTMTLGHVFLARGSALYLGLLVHGFVVPFPLFSHGGNAPAVVNLRSEGGTETAMGDGGIGLIAAATHSDELLWIDVEHAARQIGIQLTDFFESSTVSQQFLQNTMTILENFKVPSALWRVDRVVGRAALIADLKSAAVRSMSPEHTAALIALELARRYEEESNPLDSEKRDQRIYDWYQQHSSDERLQMSRVLLCTDHHSPALAAPSPDDVEWAAREVFLPSSRIADLLLRMVGQAFRMSTLAVCESLQGCGFYKGPTNFFSLLEKCALRGHYSAMPLYRRTSPFSSPWQSVFEALHSEDRLPLVAALNMVSTATVREKEQQSVKLIQKICRKHGSSCSYQFHYAIRCVDTDELHMHGVYVCTFVSSRCAVFTCIRSGRKTITYNSHSHTVSMCYLGSKERVLDSGRLQVVWIGPVTAAVEGHTAKYLMDCCRCGLHLSDWGIAVHRMEVCSALRKANRAPQFNPQWSIGTIRDLLVEASGAESETTHLQSGSPVGPAAVQVATRAALKDILSVPHPSLVLGAHDCKVVVWYHLLYALAESKAEVLSLPSSVSSGCFEAKLFGGNGKPRHRLRDAEELAHDVIRCVKAVRTGVRADISEEQRKRSTRRQRREEELRLVKWKN